MSMSFDCVCRRCGKKFDAWHAATVCDDCEPDKPWLPTPENVNALPEPVRAYIHQLETRADPAGDLRARVIAEDTVRALVKCIECNKPLAEDAAENEVRHPECCWNHAMRSQQKRHISVGLLSTLAIGSCLLIGPSTVLFPGRSWVTISLLTILLLSIIGFIVKGIRDYRANL